MFLLKDTIFPPISLRILRVFFFLTILLLFPLIFFFLFASVSLFFFFHNRVVPQASCELDCPSYSRERYQNGQWKLRVCRFMD